MQDEHVSNRAMTWALPFNFKDTYYWQPQARLSPSAFFRNLEPSSSLNKQKMPTVMQSLTAFVALTSEVMNQVEELLFSCRK